MRVEAYIETKPGYVDSGATPNEIKPVYSAYTPPTAKKKKKVERTRFRETTHTYRQKSPQAVASAGTATATKKDASLTTQKPGKKERIRFGQAPSKTLPSAPSTATEDAGAVAPAAAPVAESVNPLETSDKPTQKTRFKATGSQLNGDAPPAPDAAEVADRQAQAAPLGLGGDTAAGKKKKTKTTTGEKTRLTDEKKKPETAAPGSTAPPAATPAPAPQQ
jgi:peptidyl-prolyl cis-trans isomerase SurA